MPKKFTPTIAKPDKDAREAQAVKIMRLQALRLAKEAADKEIALNEAIAKANAKAPTRRSRAAAAPVAGDAAHPTSAR